MKKKTFFFVGMLLIGIVLLFSGMEILHAKETGQVVRVGYYELPGYSEMRDGKIAGYQYEYLLKIAEITKWKYEFIYVESYEKGVEALENGEIDLFSPAEKTQNGLFRYLYSEYSFGKKYTALVTRSEREDLSYGEAENFNHLKVAGVKDSDYMRNFQGYALERNLQIDYVFCESSKEALSLLHAKQADAAVIDYLEVQEHDRVLLRFHPEEFYYIADVKNQALMNTLNAAMKELRAGNQELLNNLESTYMTSYQIQYFTKEQRDYIKAADTLKVGYMQNAVPVSYTDAATGEFKGVTRDILDKIQELSGLRFEYIGLPEGNIDYQFLKENNIVITADVTYNKWNRTIGRMAVTMPYNYMNRVFVAKKNLTFYRNEDFRLAVTSGSQTLDKAISEEYPSFCQVKYNNVEEALDAVLAGEADAAFLNQYIADYWLGRPVYSSLGIVPAEGVRDGQCLGVLDYSETEEEDYIIIKDILDAVISQLDEHEVNMMIFENTISQRYQYSWRDFVYENKVPLFMGALLILLLMAAMIIFSTVRRKNYQILAEKERKLAIQQRRYELLIEKTEEIIFEIDLQTGDSMASGIMREKFGWTLEDEKGLWEPEDIIRRWKVHKDDAAILKKTHMETRYEGKDSECIVRLLKNGKDYVWCRVNRYPIMDRNDKIVKIIGNITNIDQMTKEAQELRTQTRTDSMTGLLNKDAFIIDVAKYLEKKPVDFCMVFLDLDHFKQVNDVLGHLTGDTAIKDTAKKLQTGFANIDLISRFGGDEFCVFIREIPVDTMKDKLEYLRRSLCAEYSKDNETVRVTASIGAVYYHRAEANVYTLLEEADKLTYQAKCEGRNRVAFKEIE